MGKSNNMIYVIGHKNPDTDSIAAAMAYADYKQKLGIDARAFRLGTLNEETKFATRYFDVEAPGIMKDARCMLEEIELDQVVELQETSSCNEAYNKIIHTNTRTLYVTENHKIKGIVSLSDLAFVRLMDQSRRTELLSKSNLDLINQDTEGTLLYANPAFETNGKVSVYDTNHKEGEYEKGILISNDELLMMKCLQSNPALVIFSGEHLDDVIREIYQAKGVSLIQTQMPVEDVLRIIYEAIPVSLVMTKEMVFYRGKEFIDDVSTKIINTRYRCYPVLNEFDEIIGSISRWHLYNYKKKQFVLVDHSSKVQTIDNIDLAEIVEIVDHHHIGDVQTSRPINYRNQTLGSTCTIIHQMYKEKGLVPDRKVAGMMLSAIISDTMFFQSKTTTELDKESAYQLANLVGVDIRDYGNQLLHASVNLQTADISDLVKRDLKQYKFSGYNVAVGQTNYDNVADLQPRMEEFRQFLREYQSTKNLDLLIMMFTHVHADGTFFLFFGSKGAVMSKVITNTFDENFGYDYEIMSRKQQLIPRLSKALEQY